MRKYVIFILIFIVFMFGCGGSENMEHTDTVFLETSSSIAADRCLENDGSDSVEMNIQTNLIEDTKLTLEKLKKLAEKGETLTWIDFEQYHSEDIGSGLYIRRYDVDEDYCLIIGGGDTKTSPMYIRLVSNKNKDIYIDIRTESIDDFINR